MNPNQTRNITTLKNWDKNPRAVKKEDFERLKKQIQELDPRYVDVIRLRYTNLVAKTGGEQGA